MTIGVRTAGMAAAASCAALVAAAGIATAQDASKAPAGTAPAAGWSATTIPGQESSGKAFEVVYVLLWYLGPCRRAHRAS